VKWPGCRADHSPASSAGVKNIWIYISTPLYIFNSIYLHYGYWIKYRDVTLPLFLSSIISQTFMFYIYVYHRLTATKQYTSCSFLPSFYFSFLFFFFEQFIKEL
jgi:hypothetical protein